MSAPSAAPEGLAGDTEPVHAGYRARRFRRSDIVAGLSVGLVVIPQSIAYAELAGMPPERGIYAAAIPLLVAAPLAFSPYLQTGPVAITCLLTFGALSTKATPGSDEYVALGLVLALAVGLFRLAIGFGRAGGIAYLMSQPMLIGFIPAAATLIAASQLPNALGAQTPEEDVIPAALWTLTHPEAWETASIVITAGVLVTVYGFRRLHPLFPSILVAALVALIYSVLADYGGPVVGTIPASLPPVSFNLAWEELPSLLLPGAVIAVVGYSEAASIARQFAAQDRQRWDSDRELVGQGAANVAAAFTGGFPVGGSFSRSSLNRLAGGWSRWSGAVTGLFVLALLPLATLLEPLPQAVLGATVIAAVLPLIRPHRVLTLWRPSRPGFVVAGATFVLTLVFAPHVERAVIAGVAMSIIVHLWRELRIDVERWREGGVLHIRPGGVLWFGAAQRLEDDILDQLAREPEVSGLVIHLDRIGRLDITAAMSLRAVVQEGRQGGVEVELAGVQERDRRLVDGVVEDVNRPQGA